MRFFILAAGMGTRLQDLTRNIPKCMVKIKDLPIISWQKKIIDSFKFKKDSFYLITGYKSSQIKISNFKKIRNPKYKDTNMLYSLFYHKHLLQGKIIISYGDIIYSKKILKKLLKSKAAISVVIDKKWKNYWQQRFKNPLDDAESLKINVNGYITEIGSKAKSINQIQGQYIGLIKLSKKGTQLFKKHFESSNYFNGKDFKKAYLTDFINDMICNGYKVKAVFIEEPWIEIDSKNDLSSKYTLNRLNKILN